MCAGMVADFDERAGDHAGAVGALESAVATSDALGLRGFLGALLARLGWDRLHVGDLAGARTAYERALELGRRLSHAPVVYAALAGSAVLHRLSGRDEDAARAASEALGVHALGGPRRLANRVDPEADVLASAAACHAVLAGAAVDRGDRDEAVERLADADRLLSEPVTSLPGLLLDDLARTRAALGTARAS
jgi:tetratricopeptide (TPR) repeat protein